MEYLSQLRECPHPEIFGQESRGGLGPILVFSLKCMAKLKLSNPRISEAVRPWANIDQQFEQYTRRQE